MLESHLIHATARKKSGGKEVHCLTFDFFKNSRLIVLKFHMQGALYNFNILCEMCGEISIIDNNTFSEF